MKLIPLTRGLQAVVDDEDYDYLMQWKWGADSHGYAIRAVYPQGKRGKQVRIRMHRVIAGTPEGMDTDHIDGNPQNNVRANLRVCSTSQNCMNRRPRRTGSSRFKGVGWHSSKGKWGAYICREGKPQSLGYFDDEVAAAQAYNRAALSIFGEFARPNVI